MKQFLAILGLAILVVGATYFFIIPKLPTDKEGVSQLSDSQILIGFSLPGTRIDRWSRDRNFFLERADELGVVVKVMDGNNDVAKQKDQIRNLIVQGVRTIVVVPIDSNSLADVLEEAREANIKVIAYDRLINNANVDFYVSFDNAEVGRMQAQSVVDHRKGKNIAYLGGSETDNNAHLLRDASFEVLNKYVASGEVEIVLDEFTPDWNPDLAFQTIDKYLEAGGKLDGIVSANDGNAGGALKALVKYGLDGKIPVSGQDADVSACRRLVAGTQSMTVYKPLKTLARKAAEAAVELAVGNTPLETTKLNNGLMDVSSYLLTPTLVTVDNLQETVIDDGFLTHEEVYSELN